MVELKRARKGRGAIGNDAGRYESLVREAFDDGWETLADAPPPLKTRVEIDTSRTVISHNESPDVPFDRSINPYRGCEHGCVYCYARPTHAWLGLSPALDFESRLFYKPNAAQLLGGELDQMGYQCKPIGLGANTDPYQPVERELRVTRDILITLKRRHHPVMVVTKSSLIERDLDLLSAMAERNLCAVSISIATLDRDIARRLEPRAAAPARRLRTIEQLAARDIPVSVLVAPVIPALTDAEIETVLGRAREAGATSASYSVLRLPLELAQIFKAWLAQHYPLKAKHVLARVRDMRGGKDYQSDFAERMRGRGPYADLLAARFALAKKRLGFVPGITLDCAQFAPCRAQQLDLL